MFAALLVSRFREQAVQEGLSGRQNWLSNDDIAPADLPLAKAAERVVASMQAVLKKTYQDFLKQKDWIEVGDEKDRDDEEVVDESKAKQERHLRLMKAVELKVVRNVQDLLYPPDLNQFQARAVLI